MVTWGIDEPKPPRADAPAPRDESPEVLADVKSWGFGHGIPQSRHAVVNVPPRTSLGPRRHRRLRVS